MARGSVKARPLADGTTRYRVKWEDRAPDGSRRHHSATRSTKKAADALLARKLAEVDRGDYVEASKEPLASYLERWLAAAATGWAGSTLHGYRSIVANRIVPYLGGTPLAWLDALAIQGCYAALLGAGYAPATVQLTHTVLDGALAQAVAWRLLPRNPADGVRVPTPRSPAPTVWDADDAAAFLAATSGSDDAALYRLAIDGGLRMGECLALAWSDVDRERGVVSVRRTLTRDADGRWVIGAVAKTTAGRRAVPIGAGTTVALRGQFARQAERRLASPAWHDLGLVFDRGDGRPCCPPTVQQRFRRAVTRAGVPPLTFHGLRHTCATLLLGAGVHPKIVQERLGHKTIAMTLDRYSHVSPGMQGAAAAALDGILGDGARPKRGHGAG